MPTFHVKPNLANKTLSQTTMVTLYYLFISIRDVLRKILTMRKMAQKDERRSQKLTELEDYVNGDEDNNGIGDFVDISDALTRSPRNSAKLKKCKSMVKKSKVCTVKHR